MVARTLQAFIFSLILLLGSFGLYGGFWYMVSLREVQSRQHAEEKMRVSAQATESVRLASLATETKSARELLRTYVVSDDDVASFLGLIERSGRALGLVVTTKSVTIDKPDGTGPFETLIVTLEVEGSYAQITQVLKLIEVMPYQVSVRSVALDRKLGGGIASPSDGAVWHGMFTIGVTKATAL